MSDIKLILVEFHQLMDPRLVGRTLHLYYCWHRIIQDHLKNYAEVFPGRRISGEWWESATSCGWCVSQSNYEVDGTLPFLPESEYNEVFNGVEYTNAERPFCWKCNCPTESRRDFSTFKVRLMCPRCKL